MTISDNAITLAKRFEGCKLTSYWDPFGKCWTIGYGVTGPGIVEGLTWIQETADAGLFSRMEAAGAAVNKYVTAHLTQNEFDALADFTYNLGSGALEESTLLRKLNDGDYMGAAQEFSRWNKAGGQVLPGLTERRAAEQALFLS